MALNHRAINNHFELRYRNDFYNEAVQRIFCNHCDFSIGRNDVHNRRGCHVKYGGMRAMMIKHIHHEHPEIWVQCQTDRYVSHIW